MKVFIRTLMVVAGLIFVTFSSCNDKYENATGPVLTTDLLSSVQYTTATGGGTISSSLINITQCGVCWSLSPGPTINDAHTSDAVGSGKFTSRITGLTPGSYYYVRAYAINSVGPGYGNEVLFRTMAENNPPVVTTSSVTDIAPFTAIGGGEVTNSGSSEVFRRGICWSTHDGPTVDDAHTSDGTGTGTFTSQMTALAQNTLYFVRAYATNEGGTSYGQQVTFTTVPYVQPPLVNTSLFTEITTNSATGGGEVISAGSSAVIGRGVCWSTSPVPTIGDNRTTDGTGIGTYISQLEGLSPGTQFYARAYALNSEGVGYGTEVTFTTPEFFSCGQPIYFGGTTYPTVIIGTDCWMGANLNTGIRISGSMDQTDNGITEKYCYRDLESNCSLYGGLYQWAELVQYLNGATNTDSWSPVPEGKVRGICPEGWHIPDETDWAVFSMNLGGDAIAGGLIKETDTLHWMAPNTGASNLSGFTSLPAGVRKSSGNFNAMGLNTWYWSATQASPVSAWYRSLSNTSETFYAFTSPWQKSTGISVRCLKDN